MSRSRTVAETAKTLPRPDERFLCQVVGAHLVAGGEAAQEAAYHFLMCLHQLGKCPFVAERHHLGNECDFRETCHVFRLCVLVFAVILVGGSGGAAVASRAGLVGCRFLLCRGGYHQLCHADADHQSTDSP